MNTCVIFGAGGFDGLAEPLDEKDYILAADGGLRHTQALGIQPSAILGDFDSLGYTPAGGQVFPVEKDDTDSMLAVKKGLELGYTRFLLYGALDGPRLDHTLANIQTLLFLQSRGARGYLVGKDHILTTVSEETLLFPADAAGVLSLFCFGPDARGVTLEGLKYPLQEGTLTSRFPLGVSNHFLGTAASVTVRDGVLVALFDRANGLPQALAI